MPMVPAMQVLACAGLIRSIAATTGPLLYASGRPKVDTQWQMIRLLVMVLLIYPCTMKWGIVGASIVVLVSILVSTIGFCYKAIIIARCSLSSFGKAVFFPLVNGIIVIVVIFLLKNNIDLGGIPGFFALMGVGVIMYLGLTYLSGRSFNYDIQSVVKDGFNSLIGR